MGFSRREYWSGLPFPSPRNLPDPGIKPRSPALQADSLGTELRGKHQQTFQPLFMVMAAHVSLLHVLAPPGPPRASPGWDHFLGVWGGVNRGRSCFSFFPWFNLRNSRQWSRLWRSRAGWAGLPGLPWPHSAGQSSWASPSCLDFYRKPFKPSPSAVSAWGSKGAQAQPGTTGCPHPWDPPVHGSPPSMGTPSMGAPVHGCPPSMSAPIHGCPHPWVPRPWVPPSMGAPRPWVPLSMGTPTHQVAFSEHICAESEDCRLGSWAVTAPEGRPGTCRPGFKHPHCSSDS